MASKIRGDRVMKKIKKLTFKNPKKVTKSNIDINSKFTLRNRKIIKFFESLKY